MAVAVAMEASNRCLSKSYAAKKEEILSRKRLHRTVTKGLKQVVIVSKSELSCNKKTLNKSCKTNVLRNSVTDTNLIDNNFISVNDTRDLKKIQVKNKICLNYSDSKSISNNFKNVFLNNGSNVARNLKKQKSNGCTSQYDIIPSTSKISISGASLIVKKDVKIELNDTDKSIKSQCTFNSSLTYPNQKIQASFIHENTSLQLQNSIHHLPSIDSES